MLPAGYQSFLPRELVPQLGEYINENLVTLEASILQDKTHKSDYLSVKVSVSGDNQVNFHMYISTTYDLARELYLIGQKDEHVAFQLDFPPNSSLFYHADSGTFEIKAYDSKVYRPITLAIINKVASDVLIRKLEKLNRDIKEGKLKSV